MITGGIDNWTENRSFRNAFAAKVSRYVDRMLGGSHDLTVGAQYGMHGSDQLNGPNDNDHHVQRLRPAVRGTTQLPYHQGAQVNWTGAYVEDTFRFGRVALNLGLRYDYSNALSFPAFPLLDAQRQPHGEMSAAQRPAFTHWSTFSPRFGIN